MLVIRAKRLAECHPNRPHKAKGLCRNCYKKQFAPTINPKSVKREKEEAERRQWQAQDATNYEILRELKIKAEIAEVMREEISRNWGKYTMSNSWGHLTGD